MKDLETRDDVYEVVRRFYALIRQDELLGPIFNRSIKDWEAHLEHLTDFWESNVFLVSKYSGNPIAVHQRVDQESGGVIEQHYFTRWLALWFLTIDGLFAGDRALLMKNRARNMSSYLYIQMFQSRSKDSK